MDDPMSAPAPPPPASAAPPGPPPPYVAPGAPSQPPPYLSPPAYQPTPPGYAPSQGLRYGPVPSIPLGGQHGGQPGAVAPPAGYPIGPPGFAPAAPVPVVTIVPATVQVRQRVGATVAIIGAAGIAAGTFLPWLRADVEGLGIRSGNGWTNILGDTGWGPLLLFLAVVAAACLAPTAVNVRTLPATVLGGAALVLAFGVSAAQLVDIERSRPGAEIVVQYGIGVLVGSAVLALIGVVVAAVGVRAAKVSAPRAVGAVG